jgi:hypothetical protein
MLPEHAHGHMDNDQAIDIHIPYHTWGPKGRMILLRLGHFREEDIRYEQDREGDLIRHLQHVLFMARCTVIDLIRSV